MAADDPTPAPPTSSGGSFLSKTWLGLPTWSWLLLVGVGGYIVYRWYQANYSSGSVTTTTSSSTTPPANATTTVDLPGGVSYQGPPWGLSQILATAPVDASTPNGGVYEGPGAGLAQFLDAINSTGSTSTSTSPSPSSPTSSTSTPSTTLPASSSGVPAGDSPYSLPTGDQSGAAIGPSYEVPTSQGGGSFPSIVTPVRGGTTTYSLLPSGQLSAPMANPTGGESTISSPSASTLESEGFTDKGNGNYYNETGSPVNVPGWGQVQPGGSVGI